MEYLKEPGQGVLDSDNISEGRKNCFLWAVKTIALLV